MTTIMFSLWLGWFFPAPIGKQFSPEKGIFRRRLKGGGRLL
jgi:hypothetical protein